MLMWQDELVNFDIVVLEQSPHYRFNRGALLNAGVLLLSSLDHDYYVFNDVDTVPAKGSGLYYAFPEGSRPLHLTPPNLHPKYTHGVRSRLTCCLTCSAPPEASKMCSAGLLWRHRGVLPRADPGRERAQH